MKKRQVLLFVILDILAINMSYLLAIYIRFDNVLNTEYFQIFLNNLVAVTLIKFIVFYIFKLYRNIWEFASIDELIEIVLATTIAGFISISYLILRGNQLTRSIYVMVTMFDMILVGGSRFFYRIFKRIKHHIQRTKKDPRVLIIGAGAAGVMVLNEIRNYGGWRYNPVAFIDDDPLKKGKIINRIPVVGNREDIISVCLRYNVDEIIIAIPSAKIDDKKHIINECSKTNCRTRILPGVYELIDGKASVSQIRDVEISDLLGRDEIKLNMDELNSFIKGKTVLVTGGGGSIGSELCRQIVKFEPSKLIILDIYENSAYDIQNELLWKFKKLNLTVLIGSVRDKERIDEIFKNYKPNIVFHAAAHKHVPLMETSPKDAVKNNILGTLNVVQAAHKYNVNKFVQISTDKAVNPTNVMGATKRVCEMIIQAYNNISNTDFVAVRFGNVLGSNGSVIPLFKKQIAHGGPITVTHPEVIRYFMTIPEACQLVLQAGSMAHGGEIFILDMGEPVKIIDLATQLIKLSGLEPGVDIEIKITGLRPGEKLYEELLLNKETASKTSHKKIFIEKPDNIDFFTLTKKIKYLEEEIDNANNNLIKELLAEMVTSYKPNITYNPPSTVVYEV